MFAVTKRLTLRPGWAEDALALTRAIGHEAVVRNLARAPWPYALGDAEAFLSLPRAAHEARFVIETRGDGVPTLIGGIGLIEVAGQHELGYWLTPDAWGRGYATEAGEVVIEMARHALPIRRLVARHHRDNPASGRVLAKLGFRETGRGATWSLARGIDVPCIEHALELEEARTQDVPMAA